MQPPITKEERRPTLGEEIANSISHGVGLVLALLATPILIVAALRYGSAWNMVGVSVFAASMVALYLASTLYHALTHDRAKRIFRMFDHGAIFLLIAGTYTPFIAQLKNSFASGGLLTGVWLAAGIGVVLKLMLPGRFDRVAVVLYLLLGWSGVMAYESMIATLPTFTFWLLTTGGVLYSMGVIFHVWRGLRFQNAIWHAFVLLAAVCHYMAVLEYAALARE